MGRCALPDHRVATHEGGARMSEYTPTTEGVRKIYAEQDPEWAAEFDRWLRGVLADAWDEAAGWAADPHIARGIRQANPYRENL